MHFAFRACNEFTRRMYRTEYRMEYSYEYPYQYQYQSFTGHYQASTKMKRKMFAYLQCQNSAMDVRSTIPM